MSANAIGKHDEEEIVKRNRSLDRLGQAVLPNMPSGIERLNRTYSMLTDWEDDLISIGTTLLFGFDLDPSSIIDQALLTDIQGKLGQIQDSLNQLNTKIDSIIKMLQDLPAVMAGVIDAELAKGWISQSKTDVGQITDVTPDLATYQANQQTVIAIVLDLERAVNNVITYSGNSVTAATLTCHAIAVWAQTKSLLLRDPKLNPTGQTIYDMSFYKSSQQFFASMMATVNAVKKEKQTTYAGIPNVNSPGLLSWLFDIPSSSFTGQPSQDCSKQFYNAAPDSDVLFAATTITFPPGGHGHCIALNTALGSTAYVDSVNVAAAVKVWPGLVPVRQDCETILAYLANSDQAFAAIQKAMP